MNVLGHRVSFRTGLKEERVLARSLRPHDGIFGSEYTVAICNLPLYFIILYYTILYYTILYYTILYYTILYCTILYYTILYYAILKSGFVRS